MSTFTVTISVTGTVKGQAVSYSDTFDVDDVYDARQAGINSGRALGVGFTPDDGYASARQACPSLIYARNSSQSQAGAVYMNDNATGDTKIMGLSAGQFILLHESVNGDGIVASNATAVTTLEEVTNVYVDAFPNFHGKTAGNVLTLNIAST